MNIKQEVEDFPLNNNMSSLEWFKAEVESIDVKKNLKWIRKWPISQFRHMKWFMNVSLAQFFL